MTEMPDPISEAKRAIVEAGPAENVMDRGVLDRILTAARFEEPDRVPIWDFIDSWPIYQHFAPGEQDPAVATAKVFNGLGIDMCRSIYMPLPPNAESETEEITYSGATRWHVNKPIKTLDDLRQYQVQEVTEEEAWQWVAAYVRNRDLFAPQTLLVPCDGVGFHAAYGLMGLERFCYAIYDAPNEVERLVQQLNYNSLQRARAFAQTLPCPLYFLGDDIAFKGRAMFPPSVMHKLFYPYLRRLCDVINEAGGKVIFHTDGYVMDIVEDLLACGIAGLNPIEPLAGNDIGELKRRYGHRLILVGNIDCSQLLPRGTPEEIRKAVATCLNQAGHGGGLFIGSSSEIVPATPVGNIFAFYQACHELGKYPLGSQERNR
jgi:uroporphyrinogen-III decarboxylase